MRGKLTLPWSDSDCMSRLLEMLGYHSVVKGRERDDVVALVLLPFVSLALLVSVGLNIALRSG